MYWTSEEIGKVRRLEGGLVMVILVVGLVEMAAYFRGVLLIGEAFVMTPLIPILATFTLYIDYEITYLQAVWRGRWVKDDFRKTTLMILGIVILGFGFDLFMSFFGGDLNRVMVDTGSGMSLICAGLYVVKRFAW